MKIVDLNEGPISNFAGGIAGAMRAKSKDPKIAAKGKAQLAKAGARSAGSKRGQAKKKKKMAALMLSKWQDQANQFRQGGLDKEGKAERGAPGIEPSLDNFNDWVDTFMNKEGIIPYDGRVDRDRAVRNYFTTLVDQFYGKADPEPVTTATPMAAPSASTPTAKQQVPLMIGRDAQQKALAAPAPAADIMKNKDAISGLKNLGYDNAGIQFRLRNAIAHGADPNNLEDIMAKALKTTKAESLERVLMSRYLLEAASGKNVHLEHIEDMVFNNGYEGAEGALTYFNQVISMLAAGSGDTAKITVKWDGAPAIVCGIDPMDGKFFVGTKSVFNTTDPKLNKNKRDLEKFHGHQPELKAKLALCLKYLPELGIGNVMQGDLMFDTVDAHPVPTTINGEKLLTFGPNTITYAVPIKSDLAIKMKRAKLGIVFHTSYDGADLPSMQASFGVDVSGYNQTKNVWFDDATYKDLTGAASLTPVELDKIATLMQAIENTMSKIRPDKFNVVVDNKEFSKFVKPFINNLVRDGRLVGNPIEFLNDFMSYYRGKMEAEIEKKGFDPDSKPAKVRMKKILDKEKFLEDNSNALLGVLAVYKRLVEIKLLLIKKLQQIEGMGTFVKDGNGYTVTEPEGFVAVGHDGGAIKLVDRLEFSKLNFANTKDWKRK